MNKGQKRQVPARRWIRFFAGAVCLAVVLVAGPVIAAETGQWPKVIETKEGKILVYQPQIESYKDNRVTARAALAVTRKDEKQPVFGVVWFSARTLTDRENRMVQFSEVVVEKIRFPDATPEEEKAYRECIQKDCAGWTRTPLSLDRFLASVAAAEKEKVSSDQLATDPPKIIYTERPTVLVVINGRPVLRGIENTGIQRVVNTPFILLYEPATATYYLKGGDAWFATPDLKGRWKSAVTPPSSVVAAAEKVADPQSDRERGQQFKAGDAPEIVVATEPAEVIQPEGPPRWKTVASTDLLYMDNTRAEVFLDTRSQQYYVLLSGRWYRSPSLDAGPWSYVPSDKLPVAFYQIPPGSDKGNVLAFVAGTREADEAVMDAQIPQTAAVKRGPAQLTVVYDGSPQFGKISGTDIEYALNTDKQVLRIRGRYYACYEAVWYVSDGPSGPWEVAESLPKEVDSIPPDSPLYNVKHVRIYDATPEEVYVGYTPGYTGSYILGGTVVYGTGYWYPGYFGLSAYYPAPITWGVSAIYDPYYGYWGYNIGFGAGFFWGFTSGVFMSPWWHGGHWWHHDHHGHHHHEDYRGSKRPPHKRPPGYSQGPRRDRPGDASRPVNLYKFRSSAVRPTHISPGPTVRPSVSRRLKTSEYTGRAGEGQPGAGKLRENNVFSSPDGNIYRKTDRGWEQREGKRWSVPEARENFRQSFEHQRPVLERDSNTRARGVERSSNFDRMRESAISRPSPAPGRPSGGVSRPSPVPSRPSGGMSGPGRSGGGGGARR